MYAFMAEMIIEFSVSSCGWIDLWFVLFEI